MKVYSDMKGPYIMLRNKAMQEAGFKEGQNFLCKVSDKKIVLECD